MWFRGWQLTSHCMKAGHRAEATGEGTGGAQGSYRLEGRTNEADGRWGWGGFGLGGAEGKMQTLPMKRGWRSPAEVLRGLRRRAEEAPGPFRYLFMLCCPLQLRWQGKRGVTRPTREPRWIPPLTPAASWRSLCWLVDSLTHPPTHSHGNVVGKAADSGARVPWFKPWLHP